MGNGAENVTISKSSGSSAGSINKKTISSTKDIFALKYPDLVMTGLETESV